MKDRDEWMRLCAQAAIGNDLEAFAYLADQIKKLLAAKELRL